MSDPYSAVIFTANTTGVDNGYAKMAKLMESSAKEQPGYLGLESARHKLDITESYWKDVEAIANW